MTWETIRKSPTAWRVAPNLGDYARACAEFSWDAARRELDGLPGGLGLNIAYEAVDRHVAAGRGDRLALRWLGKRGSVEDYTYGHLNFVISLHAALGVEIPEADYRKLATLEGCVEYVLSAPSSAREPTT